MFLLVFVVLVLLVIVSNVRIVPQGNAYVIERLGKYEETWSPGIHVKIPFIDNISNKVLLKEVGLDFEPQSVITKDNVAINIDSVVFMRVFRPDLYTYGVHNPIAAIENLTITTMRNIIGTMSLDETLTSRDKINAELTLKLDEATDKWGIKVNRVEVKSILPPRQVQDAMEQQMKAEREKRAQILKAEGAKGSAVLIAEGEKKAAILRAEAAAQSKILAAEAEAKSIDVIKEAEARGLMRINMSKPTAETVSIKGLDVLEKLGNSQNTKIIIPTELSKLSGIIESLK